MISPSQTAAPTTSTTSTSGTTRTTTDCIARDNGNSPRTDTRVARSNDAHLGIVINWSGPASGRPGAPPLAGDLKSAAAGTFPRWARC